MRIFNINAIAKKKHTIFQKRLIIGTKRINIIKAIIVPLKKEIV